MAAENKNPNLSRYEKAKFINPLDLLILLGQLVLGVLAWTVPERKWRGMTYSMAAAGDKMRPGAALRNLALIRHLYGDKNLSQTPEEIRRELDAGYIEENIQLLRCYRPGGWSPSLETHGLDNLDAALAQGKGAILLITFTAFNSLASKIAISATGRHITHLSHPRHGFSKTRFGMAVINPICTYIEAKFLGERVVMFPANPVAAMRYLRRRLGEGGVVSIMARELARHPVETPFLEGSIMLATGAVDLAIMSGAPLLPMSTIQHDDGTHHITIDAPLQAPQGLPRDEARQHLLKAFTLRMDAHVRSRPGQWRGWYYMQPERSD